MRSRRQVAEAIVFTGISSVGVLGWCSSSNSSTIAKNNSLFSVSSTTASASRPCLVAFLDELRLPSGVMGPLDLAPLSFDAAICAGVLIACSVLAGCARK